MARLQDIVRLLDDHLEPARFSDSALNGLQVEGDQAVSRIALGVSSSQRFFTEALAWGAEALLVHHGLFWGAPRPIVGPLAGRLRTLLAARASLVAYHLPLDAHPEDGNNAVIARKFGLLDVELWGDYRGRKIGTIGTWPELPDGESFLDVTRRTFGEHLVILGEKKLAIGRVAICSGGGGSMVEQALEARADVLVTGEPGEPAQEIAIEGGLLVIGAGHYNTERFGVQALGRRLETAFDVETRFIDVPNPI